MNKIGQQQNIQQANSICDIALWGGVGGAGLIYWYYGVCNFSGGFVANPKVCKFWCVMKLFIAASLLDIQFRHEPGPYTLPFGLLEMFWSFGFGVWYIYHGDDYKKGKRKGL